MRKESSRLIVAIFYSLIGLALFILISCGGGGSDTQPTTNHAPVASAGPNQSVLTGSLVTLDGTGSYDVDGDPLTYSWALTAVPAGSTAVFSAATSSRPTFVPNLNGNYVARLIVNDGKAESAGATVTITAQPTISHAPVASAGPNQNVSTGSIVTLDGSGSYDPDNDSLTYSWVLTQVPNGSTATLSNSNAVGPTFVPNLSGAYVARLIVKDPRQDMTSEASYVTIWASSTTYGDNQLWKLETIEGTGYFRIVAKHSGKVLGVDGGSIAPGAQVIQCTYNGGDDQKFYFDSLNYDTKTGLYGIIVKQQGLGGQWLCLNVENDSLAEHAKVQQQLCWSGASTSERWYFTDNGNGYYKIKNDNSGKCINVTGASLADGAIVQQYTCD